MKILVTGGAGFIGSHLVPLLLQAGHGVTVLDNFSTGCREHIPAGVELLEMDLLSDRLTEVLQQHRFEAVVHLAAQTMVSVSQRQPRLDAEQNVLGTVNLLEAARLSGVRRIVMASSAAVYGDADEAHLPLTEKEQTAPLSFYGLTKLTAESYCARYQRSFGLEYVVLRFANVYGERQGDAGEGGVISIFARAAADGKEINVYGDGEQTRDFIYAGDVARGIMAALQTSHPNAVYNLSTCRETSVNTLLAELGTLSGHRLQVHYLAARDGDIRRSALDNSRARTGLGWEPRISIATGLAKTCAQWQIAVGGI